jgi:hypothetical protein
MRNTNFKRKEEDSWMKLKMTQANVVMMSEKEDNEGENIYEENE